MRTWEYNQDYLDWLQSNCEDISCLAECRGISAQQLNDFALLAFSEDKSIGEFLADVMHLWTNDLEKMNKVRLKATESLCLFDTNREGEI